LGDLRHCSSINEETRFPAKLLELRPQSPASSAKGSNNKPLAVESISSHPAARAASRFVAADEADFCGDLIIRLIISAATISGHG
jgi:hypothetical protein